MIGIGLLKPEAHSCNTIPNVTEEPQTHPQKSNVIFVRPFGGYTLCSTHPVVHPVQHVLHQRTLWYTSTYPVVHPVQYIPCGTPHAVHTLWYTPCSTHPVVHPMQYTPCGIPCVVHTSQEVPAYPVGQEHCSTSAARPIPASCGTATPIRMFPILQVHKGHTHYSPSTQRSHTLHSASTQRSQTLLPKYTKVKHITHKRAEHTAPTCWKCTVQRSRHQTHVLIWTLEILGGREGA